MSRFPTIPQDQLSGPACAVHEQIRKAAGKLPNAYALIGAYSPAAMSLLLSGDAALSKGQLSRRDIEAVRLGISQQNGCDYCVAGHTLVGKLVGLSPEETRAARAGQASGNPQRDALVAFTREVASTRGTVPEATLQAVLDAGYTPGQVVEALFTVALISFTNLFNRVNDTTLDYPNPDA